jgi:hypothetical protein
MDQVVVLLIGLPPSTPNPWSAQIRPNTARITPTANVTTKVLLIQGAYARDLVTLVDAASTAMPKFMLSVQVSRVGLGSVAESVARPSERRRIVTWPRRARIEVTEAGSPAGRAGLVVLSAFGGDVIGPVLGTGATSCGHHRGSVAAVVDW